MLKALFYRLLGRDRQRGQSSIEVLMTMALLAIAAQAVMLVVRTAAKQNVSNRDRLLATEKALQMLEEVRSVVMDESQQITVLDQNFNDGSALNAAGQMAPVCRYTLTTRRDITDCCPAGQAQNDWTTGTAPLSGNPVRGTGYAFVRNVSVESFTNASGYNIDPHVRRVWVRVWAAAPNHGTAGGDTPTAQTPSRPLAQVFGIVHSLGAANQPTQVLDVYLLALESVPGWWSKIADLVPIFNAALVSLQSRNPGLNIRPHWIQTMSFGRDFEYTPEYNYANSTEVSRAFKKTYVYPGISQYKNQNDGSAYQDQYYMQTWFKGRINQDGSLINNNQESGSPGAPFTNNMGYPIADQFNHAMRLPDEERLYQTLQAIATNNGAPHVELSWRQVLDRMNDPSNPDFPGFQNSILIDLHGEMLPVPPLRNYSDAAKDPDYYEFTKRYDAVGNTLPYRAWRAVSHAERLAYSSVDGLAVTSTVTVKVYGWDMNPPADPISVADENDVIDNVTLFIKGATLSNLAEVDRLQGNSRTYYKWISRTVNTSPAWVNDGTTIHDGATLAGSTFVADQYSPPGGRADSGLRIRLLGVTPTARLYVGPAY